MDETGDSSVLRVACCLAVGLFMWSGIGQANGFDTAAIFIERSGTIVALLPLAVVIEVTGALFLMVGYSTRGVSLVPAGFCVVTALLFHANFADRVEMFQFLKNAAITGGLLTLFGTAPAASPSTASRRRGGSSERATCGHALAMACGRQVHYRNKAWNGGMIRAEATRRPDRFQKKACIQMAGNRQLSPWTKIAGRRLHLVSVLQMA